MTKENLRSFLKYEENDSSYVDRLETYVLDMISSYNEIEDFDELDELIEPFKEDDYDNNEDYYDDFFDNF